MSYLIEEKLKFSKLVNTNNGEETFQEVEYGFVQELRRIVKKERHELTNDELLFLTARSSYLSKEGKEKFLPENKKSVKTEETNPTNITASDVGITSEDSKTADNVSNGYATLTKAELVDLLVSKGKNRAEVEVLKKDQMLDLLK